MMRAAEQGPKQESFQDIEISMKTFGYSVKFDVRIKTKKNQWASHRNVISLPRLDLGKILAHCDG